jgi:AcrR family transcriptional regulator
MQKSGSKRGRKRVYDAERTRAAILNAAEAGFAEHGFDGVSVDAIAAEAGYNKSLIFQYFGDKLGLYTAVLKRADQEMSALLARVFGPLLGDETIAADAGRFRAFLKTMFEAFYDYMIEHPRFMRMLNWEQAEGWQTFAGIASQFEPGDLARLEAIFSTAQQAGLLRPDLDIIVVLLLIQQICWSAPAAIPMHQLLLVGRGLDSTTALAHVREQVIAFLIAAITTEPGRR